jgi:ribosome-associated translation inhibitor RaiA
MKIQVHTDNAIEGSARLTQHVESVVSDTLARFGDQITRVEVHLRDVNGPRVAGDDKRCLMEARLAGRQPTVVTHDAPNVEVAIDGAVEKLQRSLDKVLGRLGQRKGRESYGREEEESP